MRALSPAVAMFAIAGSLAAKVNFVRDVEPILENRCVRCHGPDNAMRGIRHDTRLRAWMAVVPHRPDESPLFSVAKSGLMPPGGPRLAPAEIEMLRRWIAEGARWPKGVELRAKSPSRP